jgi:hypothetical protein
MFFTNLIQNNCGGTSVDNAFFQTFVKILGGPVMNILQKKYTSSYMDLFREFEAIKRTIKPNTSDKVNFTIPYVVLLTFLHMHLQKPYIILLA